MVGGAPGRAWERVLGLRASIGKKSILRFRQSKFLTLEEMFGR